MFNQKITKGFSLIELLIAISISAIMLMISVPAYHLYLAKAKMVDFFLLANAHKLKLLDKIIYLDPTDLKKNNYTLDNPNKVVSKLEQIINQEHKKYIIRMTANMSHLGIKIAESKPLIVDFIAEEDDVNGLITWNCEYNQGYYDIMPKNCKELSS